MARATGGGEWPNIEPVSPRQKSSSRLPSISVIVAPRAVVLGFTGLDEAPESLTALVEVARTLPPAIELWVGGAGVPAAAKAVPGERVLLLEDFDTYERHLGRLRGRDTGVSPAGA